MEKENKIETLENFKQKFSFQNIFDQFLKNIFRFPILMTTVFLNVIFVSSFVIFENRCGMYDFSCVPSENFVEKNENNIFEFLFYSVIFLFPLFLNLDIFFRKNLKNIFESFVLIFMFFLILYFDIFENNYGNSEFSRDAGISLFLYSGLMFKSFKMSKTWIYWKKLAISFLITSIFYGIFLVGISIGYFAIVNLFEIQDSEIFRKTISVLYIFIFGIFPVNTFLAGIPDNFNFEKQELKIPNILTLFGKYILIPLSVLYGLIVFAYFLKILITWDWPEGMISWIVVFYSIMIFFISTIFYPELSENKKENKTENLIMKIFYFSLPFASVIFSLAIYIRVDFYGFTENRYYLALIAILIFISGILLFLKKENMRYIFVLISGLSLFSTFPIIGATDFSERNQEKRLEDSLKSLGILENNQIKKLTEFEIRQNFSEDEFYKKAVQVNSSLDFFIDRDREKLKKMLKSWNADFDQKHGSIRKILSEVFGIPCYYGRVTKYCVRTIFEEENPEFKYSRLTKNFSYPLNREEKLDIKNYDYVLINKLFYSESEFTKYISEKLELNNQNSRKLEKDFKNFYEELFEKHQKENISNRNHEYITTKDLIFTGKYYKYEIKIIFQSMEIAKYLENENSENENEKYEFSRINLEYFLISEKN